MTLSATILALALIIFALAVLAIWMRAFTEPEWKPRSESLVRAKENPLFGPSAEHPWENEAAFNPAAVLTGGTVRLFYRALGKDGLSRIGYAESTDGIHFDRFPAPAFVMKTPPPVPVRFNNPFVDQRYDRDGYASGGGWGGSEDPRAVVVDGTLYMSFGVFESWESLRLALTSLPVADLEKREWKWTENFFISPPGEANKNWVMFPEKIRGKFAIIHALTPSILIDYADSPEEWHTRHIRSDNRRGGRQGHWDAFVRGAAAPPIRTKSGWLLLYHGMDPAQGPGYKVGAMLLDLEHPEKILYRSAAPVLEPKEWYENDWKPGVVYASGAIVKDGTLFVYYGGGDKTVNVATAPLDRFLKDLMKSGRPALAVRTA